MASLATHRLIDAAARLDPAERALLNLWVNRGLDDDRLTALTGLSFDALHMRREKIVARLAGDLGLPDEDVRTALEQISPDAALSPPTSDRGAGDAPSHNGAMTIPESPRGAPTGTRRTRRWLWVGLLALMLIAVVVVAIIADRGSSSPALPPATGTPGTATTAARTPTVPAAHPTTGNPVPPPWPPSPAA
jgi:hypothetical protein